MAKAVLITSMACTLLTAANYNKDSVPAACKLFWKTTAPSLDFQATKYRHCSGAGNTTLLGVESALYSVPSEAAAVLSRSNSAQALPLVTGLKVLLVLLACSKNSVGLLGLVYRATAPQLGIQPCWPSHGDE
jgi:hypothetical protein